MYIVAAYDQGLGMGHQFGLPWPTIQADLDRMLRVSANSLCIMGHTTYAGLPSTVLRTIEPIIVSRHADVRRPGHTIVRSLDEALAVASLRGNREPAIWGGTRLFIEALNHPALTHAYITRVLDSFPADTFFPDELLRRKLPTITPLPVSTDPSSGVSYRFLTRTR